MVWGKLSDQQDDNHFFEPTVIYKAEEGGLNV